MLEEPHDFEPAVAHIATSDEFWIPILGGDMNNCPNKKS
jgi:hypothetical protein